MVLVIWFLLGRYSDVSLSLAHDFQADNNLEASSISLDASTGNWTGSAVTPAASRSAASGTQAIEGSGMYKSGDEYYVFSSWDACCIGASDTYNIRVGRSSR